MSFKDAWRGWLWTRRFRCYRRTGARLLSVSDDVRRVRVALPFNRNTRGYFGTLFGGSLYGAVDPIYMVMLNENLGPGYQAWDREAVIRFRKAGLETVYGDFEITDADIAGIKDELVHRRAARRSYTVELKTATGEICATIEKTLFISKISPGTGDEQRL